MFRFDFNVGEDLESETACSSTPEEFKLQFNLIPAQELPELGNLNSGWAPQEVDTIAIGRQTLKKRRVKGDDLLRGILADSDLVSGVYEGGFKVWECAVDMVEFLNNEWTDKLHGKRVADIGCGHGFPGIFCLQKGASFVAFQDLNREVLTECTMHNLALNNINLPDALLQSRGFYCGDWRDTKLAGLMQGSGNKFDLLVTCDTLYSVASMPYLLRLVDDLLSEHGVLLVAAKRFYFGVGGSTGEFIRQLDEWNKGTDQGSGRSRSRFKATVAHTVEDGKSNVREILHIERI